ncbi:hypothetical protein TWF191_004038 [Orbilia oligospora]|uniref:Uncharacterized protein n=1 Tax=Orbilia oligospora TaxID=2813651 RepID=A0A7C8UZH5_ORBOL|nr:hypothetical protein TWF191_004038 [Orbilia oligospora]
MDSASSQGDSAPSTPAESTGSWWSVKRAPSSRKTGSRKSWIKNTFGLGRGAQTPSENAEMEISAPLQNPPPTKEVSPVALLIPDTPPESKAYDPVCPWDEPAGGRKTSAPAVVPSQARPTAPLAVRSKSEAASSTLKFRGSGSLEQSTAHDSGNPIITSSFAAELRVDNGSSKSSTNFQSTFTASDLSLAFSSSNICFAISTSFCTTFNSSSSTPKPGQSLKMTIPFPVKQQSVIVVEEEVVYDEEDRLLIREEDWGEYNEEDSDSDSEPHYTYDEGYQLIDQMYDEDFADDVDEVCGDLEVKNMMTMMDIEAAIKNLFPTDSFMVVPPRLSEVAVPAH